MGIFFICCDIFGYVMRMLTEIAHESQSDGRHRAVGSLCDCFSCVCFLQMLQFPPTAQTQIGLMGASKLLLVVSVSGR